MRESFRKFASCIALAVGSPWAFILAVVAIVAWALCGPWYRWSEGWQMVVNTGTTITTFLMVFIIQNTQNRDSQELHLKLNELIRSSQARNETIHSETLDDSQLHRELKRDA